MKNIIKSKRVILFERNKNTEKSLIEYLEGYGFQIIPARMNDVTRALKTVEEVASDIVILNIGYLCAIGKEILRKIYNNYATPIILITAKGKNVDCIVGLELGADDCISNQLDPREIVARMRAILRRVSKGKHGEKNEKQNSKTNHRWRSDLLLLLSFFSQSPPHTMQEGVRLEAGRIAMGEP